MKFPSDVQVISRGYSPHLIHVGSCTAPYKTPGSSELYPAVHQTKIATISSCRLRPWRARPVLIAERRGMRVTLWSLSRLRVMRDPLSACGACYGVFRRQVSLST